MKISIITVCYNREHTVGQAIESVLAQDYPDIEYIVVDGASTDGSLQVIRQYDGQLSRVLSEPDHGMYEAINKGIRMATGEVIGLLHSDDFLFDSHVISDMAECFQRTGADLVYGNGLFVDAAHTERVVRNWIDTEYVSAAMRSFVFLLGTDPFMNIIRSVERTNPMKLRLSRPRKGS